MNFFRRRKAATVSRFRFTKLGLIYFNSVFLFVVFGTSLSALGTIPSTAGIELGGNGSLLLTDPTIGAFGMGAGSQSSIFLTMWTDHPIMGKMRIETISMREEAIQKSASDYILTGSNLKAATQSWNMISFGAQGGFSGHGQTFFWEALLGYAIGQPGVVSLTYASPDTGVTETSQTSGSGFVISGGMGIKRVFSPTITGLFAVRSLLLLGPTYSGSPLNGKTFIPLPLSFNIGVEIPFAF